MKWFALIVIVAVVVTVGLLLARPRAGRGTSADRAPLHRGPAPATEEPPAATSAGSPGVGGAHAADVTDAEPGAPEATDAEATDAGPTDAEDAGAPERRPGHPN